MFSPTSTIPPLPFSEFVFFCSLVIRTLLAWHGTFLTKHWTLPWPPYRPRTECNHSIPGVGLDGPVSLPFRPTITIGSAPPTRKPRTFHAGHRLGWGRPPLTPAPCATILPRTTLPATSAPAGHRTTPSTPSPPQNLRRVYSAHEIAADSLASSGNGAVDTGLPPGLAFRPPFVLSIAHHRRLRLSPS